jgi:unsaturated rhamnogalacturonyl hydrolase
MKLLRLFLLVALLMMCAVAATAQGERLSVRMADSVMARWPEGPVEQNKPVRWHYDMGVILKGFEGIWMSTGEGKYFDYVRRSIDRFVADDGTIRTYKVEDYNIDNILSGRNVLTLYKVTGQEKYRKAAAHLRAQLASHPRTSEGGFWHKKIYPHQMWLDGLYMGEPFYAEYAVTFGEPAAFDDIAKQFVLMERNSRDARTGLLYHGWDESRQQRWADPKTGRSPNFWGRAMGWYAMALVDTLEHFPAEHPRRRELVGILERLAAAITRVQEPKSGLWYQVLDKGGEKGNYLEASASCMFAYALAKGVRQGNLPANYLNVARKAYDGIVKQFIREGEGGRINLEGTVSVAGLGGNPYRDGSYEYYLSEKVVTDDPKGVGAFLLASNELELASLPQVGAGKTVALDYYFNNEVRKGADGRPETWHYKWDEMPNAGFSLLGHVFRSYGARTEALRAAPTRESLKRADVYIIVDPDTKDETESPNFVEPAHVEAVAEWVRAGGVLVLLANDVGNAELDRFNTLAGRFGVRFNKDSRNRVQGNDYAAGRVPVAKGHPVFKTARNLYLKEISTLSIEPPARPLLEDGGAVIMAVAKYGKGTVFALGDPWLYNEYVDGRKLPPEFDNFRAARDLAAWLLQQSAAKGK